MQNSYDDDILPFFLWFHNILYCARTIYQSLYLIFIPIHGSEKPVPIRLPLTIAVLVYMTPALRKAACTVDSRKVPHYSIVKQSTSNSVLYSWCRGQQHLEFEHVFLHPGGVIYGAHYMYLQDGVLQGFSTVYEQQILALAVIKPQRTKWGHFSGRTVQIFSRYSLQWETILRHMKL
jgi:hypothetical protein